MAFTNSTTTARLSALDALRGFALFGVLVTNTFLFNAYEGGAFASFYGSFSGELQQATVTVVHYFFRSRFYPIFSLLFGLGLGLQYLRLQANHQSQAILWRRVLVLFLIGLCHFIFIWDGDILIRYSVAGILVILLAPAPPKAILGSGAALYLIHCIYAFTGSAPDLEIPGAITPVTRLSYLQFIQHRAASVFDNNFTMANGFYTLRITSFILLGLWVAKSFKLSRLDANTSVWKKLFLVFLLSRVAIAVVSFLISDYHNIVIILSFLSSLLNIGLYVTGFLMLLPLLNHAGLSRYFIAAGRMSLTNYILQSMVLAFVFYGYGLGQYQQWEPFIYLLFASGLFAVQAIISYGWLRKHKQGPLEALWRFLVNVPGHAKPQPKLSK